MGGVYLRDKTFTYPRNMYTLQQNSILRFLDLRTFSCHKLNFMDGFIFNEIGKG